MSKPAKSASTPRLPYRPSIRTLLLVINVVILLLPILGIFVARIYESALVRQTESELISQAAFVSASYRRVLSPWLVEQGGGYGHLADPRWRPPPEQKWSPQPPRLDLAVDTILPKPMEARDGGQPAHEMALRAGRVVQAVMLDAQTVTLAGMRVVDPHGTVVATTGNEFGLNIAHRREVSRALTGEHVSVLRARVSDEPPPPFSSISRGAGVRVFVAMPVMVRDRVIGAVITSRTPRNLTQALYSRRWLLFGGALFLGFTVLSLTLFTFYTINRPIKRLVLQARRAMTGEKNAVVVLERPVTREIAQLTQAVATMAQTLERRADELRQFSSHISHAFKTPLTAIEGSVELLLDHYDTMDSQQRLRFLNNIQQDSAYLRQLTQRLMELARADAGGDETQHCRVVPCLRQLASDSVHIHVPQNGGDEIQVPVDCTLFISMINNLIDNSVVHGRATRVDIEVDAGSSRLCLKVRDNGSGITDNNLEKIFQPFFTTARDRGGTGLGLPLVKKLAQARGGDLCYEKSERGSCFCILLPTL